MNKIKSNKKFTFAVIAHDGKKLEMVEFLTKNQDLLKNFTIISTGTTGKLAKKSRLNVTSKLSGPLGGDAQIAAMVAMKKIDLVFFFRDPLGKHPHEPDIQMLMRLCDVHNIPLATNPASAQFMLIGILKQRKSKSRETP